MLRAFQPALQFIFHMNCKIPVKILYGLIVLSGIVAIIKLLDRLFLF